MQQVALITGASGGIGYEIANVLAQHGHPLILIARNKERLSEVAAKIKRKYGVPVHDMIQDLSQPIAPEKVYAEVQRLGFNVDILVNNAGFGVFGPFIHTDVHEQMEMVRLNIGALTHLTHLFLPGMVGRRDGRILNVASTAAFVPGPFMSVYYATKAYVVSFSQALHEELRGSGVSVTAVCPGPTDTDFKVRARAENLKLFQGGILLDPATVARAAYIGMQSGRAIVTPGWKNQLLVQGVRLAPRASLRRIVRWISRGTGSK